MQADSINRAQEELNSEKEVMQRFGVHDNSETHVCVEMQQLAESLELVYGKIGALDNDVPEVAQIIAQIAAIAKEIFELAEYEVPTMKKM